MTDRFTHRFSARLPDRFADRYEAGRRLAAVLETYARRSDVVVLALPRGGVEIGYEIARALRVPLDVLVVRKLGVPGYEELAFGAIASGGVRVINSVVVSQLGLDEATIRSISDEQANALEARIRTYRGTKPAVAVQGRTVILVDDGLATGASMRAALVAVRQLEPAFVVVAVPVAAPSICSALRSEADELVCLLTPEPFSAVGLWYENFDQTSDDEVRELLDRSGTFGPGSASVHP